MKNKPYYGPFFWIAVCSFIVPIFVAYSAFNTLRPTTKPEPQLDASGVDHNIWDYLLKNYVASGLVDYQGISKDYLFWEYIKQIGAADVAKLSSEDEKLALHCNAYNALVIKGVVNHNIDGSVMDFDLNGAGFFAVKEHVFAGKTMSLDDLEKGIILPVFKEPRVHVILVCAAISCPPLRSEAYVGERIKAQLEDQASLFANDEKFVSFDSRANTLHLSRLLDWYKSDFSELGGVFDWLVERVEDQVLRDKIESAKTGGVKVEYNTYDWTLNAQKVTKSSGGTFGGFGSSSVPNE